MTGTGIPGFDLGELIGRGGCASVYRARQLSVDRDVALKIDNRHVADERDRRRFLREVTAVGRLSGHPHVIEIYDAGVLADDRPYIAMQLCPNGSLYEHVRDVAPLTGDELQRVGVQLADALATAHEAGIVHRDVKPGNMLVNGYGVVVLSDFGLASILDADSRQSATRGVFTPAYAAPEALAQEEPTPAMDLWSFACTVFELATGRLPRFRIHGEPIGAEEIRAAAAAEADADDHERALPVRLPPDLLAWLVRGLAFDPAQRWSSAAQMRDELAALDLGLLARVPAAARRPVLVPGAPASRSFSTPSPSVPSRSFPPARSLPVSLPVWLATQASPEALPEPAVPPVPAQPPVPTASAPVPPDVMGAPRRPGSSAEWWEPATARRPDGAGVPAPGRWRSELPRPWLLAALVVVALAATAVVTWVVSGRAAPGSPAATRGGSAAATRAAPPPSASAPVVIGSNGPVVIGAGGAPASADPAGLWVLDGDRVRAVLDRITATAGHPLRFVQVLGAHGSGYSLLVVQVQDPADHETVLQYTVDAGGSVTGPQQTSSASLLDPGASRLTPAMVDRKTFGRSALLAPALFARAQRDAVARTHIRNAEVSYWTLNALEGRPRLLLGVESSYGKAIVEIGRHGEVLRVIG